MQHLPANFRTIETGDLRLSPPPKCLLHRFCPQVHCPSHPSAFVSVYKNSEREKQNTPLITASSVSLCKLTQSAQLRATQLQQGFSVGQLKSC